MAGWIRRYWWATGVAIAALIGLGVYLALPSPQPARVVPPTRARAYSAFDACLITDSEGVAGQGAAPVWAGMQTASAKTTGKVSYLAVAGPDTVANAEIYVNTLIQRKCDLVIAVGAAQVSAARVQAKTYPAVKFVVVDTGATAGNVTVIAPGAAGALSDAVAATVESAYRS